MPPAAVGAALGTKAIMALVLGTVGAKAATDVYATRSAGRQNRRAMEATERSDTRAAELERERLAEERRALDAQLAEERRYREEQATLQREESARRERLYNEAVQRDRERYQEYLRAWQPHWQAGAGVLGNLYDIAGVSGGRPNPAAAAAAMPPDSALPPAGGMRPSGGLSELATRGQWGHITRGGTIPMDISSGGPPVSSTMPVPPRRGSVLPRPEMPRPQAMSLTDLMAMGEMANRFAPSAPAPALYQGF